MTDTISSQSTLMYIVHNTCGAQHSVTKLSTDVFVHNVTHCRAITLITTQYSKYIHTNIHVYSGTVNTYIHTYIHT